MHQFHNVNITGPVLFRIVFSAFLGGLVGSPRNSSDGLLHRRAVCIIERDALFLTLHSRNVWSAPKGTRVFSTRKHGVVYSLTAVPNG